MEKRLTEKRTSPSFQGGKDVNYTTGTWTKGVVSWIDGTDACLSVVFSWDADDAYQQALWYKAQGYRIKIGGPAVHTMRKFFLGVADTIGGDLPDAVRHHNPMATYASKGCPVGCWFCIVPSMDGRTFTLLPDFPVRPVLCDNNLSGLPADFQNHVIGRYLTTGVPLLDANSGFEPRTFDDETYRRWKAINRGPWRLAFDDMAEEPYVERAMRVLKNERPNQTRIYVLIGNEPVDACLHRIRKVLEWGGEPHAQPLLKLNCRTKTPWVRHDWTTRSLRACARWANRRLWRYVDFADYTPKGCRQENLQPHLPWTIP